ncbi:hypothetical protein H0H92_008928 [Tricholoma furcatifolium]|nr:hypothetical protein H0H92_008928 [Tricholoma furcatifolium]
MADFNINRRDLKRGREWTQNDLERLNITIQPHLLFPDPDLKIHPAIVNCPPGDNSSDIPDSAEVYLGSFSHAIDPSSSQPMMDRFLSETLNLLGFDDTPGAMIKTQYPIPFSVDSRDAVAEADICVVHTPSLIILLPLIEDNKFTKLGTNAEAVVVAHALAAYEFNNQRRFASFLPHAPAMIIPCILMTGTRPTFFFVPVTKALSRAVITGERPTTETKVLRCHIPLSDDMSPEVDMADTKYRRLAFKCLLKFKEIAGMHWRAMMVGMKTV